jgi:hypothetical protein
MNDVQSLMRSLGGNIEYREFANWRSPRAASQLAAEQPAAATPLSAAPSRTPGASSLLAAYAATARDGQDDAVQSRRVPLTEVFALLERRAV